MAETPKVRFASRMPIDGRLVAGRAGPLVKADVPCGGYKAGSVGRQTLKETQHAAVR
jgi:hypothetical protein